MIEKIAIWESACKTDVSATKANTQGGRQSTSINGYWMFKKATEIWGPMGSSWGFEILEDKFTDGVPILGENSNEMLCMSQMHSIKLRLWYPECNELGVVAIGHTPYVYSSRRGPICDMEAPKKSLTDAQKKALSMLGFSADVFMGEFDDKSYVEERINEEALEKAENKIEEKQKQAEEYEAWRASHLNLIETASNMNELKKLFAGVVRKMDVRGDRKGIQVATKAKDIRKTELEEK